MANTTDPWYWSQGLRRTDPRYGSQGMAETFLTGRIHRHREVHRRRRPTGHLLRGFFTLLQLLHLSIRTVRKPAPRCCHYRMAGTTVRILPIPRER